MARAGQRRHWLNYYPSLEGLEDRRLPSTLFQDLFNTEPNLNGGGWNDINHGFDAGRQSGLLAPMTYLEADPTAPGGPFDSLTQVNNPVMPESLQLGVEPAAGQSFTSVSPGRAFGSDVSHIHVAIDPLGPGSASAADHWAAVVFGTTPESFVVGNGTGVLVRDSGEYELWDRGTQVQTGFVGAKTIPQQFYTIDFAIVLGTGQFTLSIDGHQLFTGTHGRYTTNYVTLEDNTDPTLSGTQLDYFSNLAISGTTPFAVITAMPNTTYYVSPTGEDGDSGTSPDDAWQTIAQVNKVDFRPGDQILFEGGSTFSGSLTFDSQDIGTASAPVTVGSYGTGRATISAGNNAGISVLDGANIRITNLIVVGSGYASNQNDGIMFMSDLASTTIVGVAVANVDVSRFGHVGIEFLGTNGSNDFRGISVTNSSSHDNGEGGVSVDGQGNARNVYVGHVKAIHNAGSLSNPDSGYGILIVGANDAEVERSVSGNNGWLAGQVGEMGGIEAINSNRVLLQYNESYSNRRGTLGDGDGINLDTVTSSMMQFNYSHDNDGGGLFLGAEGGTNATNNVVRYNISQNDARSYGPTYGGIFLWLDLVNADVYNNTVFMGPSSNSSPAALRLNDLSGSGIHVWNNILVTTGGVPVVNFDVGTANPVLQGNDYYASGAAFQILWLGTTFNSLTGTNSFTAVTHEEMINSTVVGLTDNPQLNNAGGGGTIGNADKLSNLTAYQLQSTSPVRHGGLDLSKFSVAWDPYGFASDSFFKPHFPAVAQDFYDHVLPSSGTSLFSMGADQLT
jgi:hypothetical protein